MRRGSEWAQEQFAEASVARLATASSVGTPHLVPITFALVGTNILTAVDDKPKSTKLLRRLDNIADNPFVSVLVDAYDDDWDQLWWARADGWARVRPAEEVEGFDTLVAKYPRYRETTPPGPVIVIVVDRWSGWSAR